MSITQPESREEPQKPALVRAMNTVTLIIEEWLPGTLIAVMALGVTASVIARYIFHSPILGVPELATGAMVWVVFIGSAAVSRRGLHVALDVVTKKMPPRWKAAFAIVAGVCTVVILSLLLYWAWALTAGTHRVLPMTGLPAKVVWIALPIGSALMIIRELIAIGRAVIGLRSGDFDYPKGSFEDDFGLEEV